MPMAPHRLSQTDTSVQEAKHSLLVLGVAVSLAAGLEPVGNLSGLLLQNAPQLECIGMVEPKGFDKVLIWRTDSMGHTS